MDKIVTPDEAAALLYGEKASKAKANVIRRQCVDGIIKNAEKNGRSWFINASREWPKLFPAEQPAAPAPEPQRRITVDTTVGELLAMLLDGCAAEQPALGRR